MNDLENYAALVNSVFGSGATTFKTNLSTTNNVIGALNQPNDFLEFKANYKARLERLKKIYSTHSAYLKEVLVQVNQIADHKNWDGAFAELSAYDHLNQDILKRKVYIQTPIKPNVTIPVDRTLGRELGKQETNLDGYVEDRLLYFDVKTFKDNVSEILEGVYKEVFNHFRITGLHISAEHSLDISYDDFQKKRMTWLTS